MQSKTPAPRSRWRRTGNPRPLVEFVEALPRAGEFRSGLRRPSSAGRRDVGPGIGERETFAEGSRARC